MSILSKAYLGIPPAPTLLGSDFATRIPVLDVPGLPDARAERVAVISHEMRNSLGVVRNAARVLRMDKSALGIDGARLLIERHVGQMNRYVEDLLASARPAARNKALRLAHLDLRTIVGQAIDAIAADLARRSHRLVVSLPEEPIYVHADGGRLEQVFSNLLINAAKYTPDGGDIGVLVERIGTHVSVRIRDSGIGITPGMLTRVFEMYVQVDANAPRAEGGRGIGLGVVRELVELHNGTVMASSAGLGAGSEFTVLLPAPWAPLDAAPNAMNED